MWRKARAVEAAQNAQARAQATLAACQTTAAAATERAIEAEARASELEHRFDRPVTTRPISTATESNRRRH